MLDRAASYLGTAPSPLSTSPEGAEARLLDLKPAGRMSFGLETSWHVEVVNTIVTAVATALVLFLTPGLQKWLSRRYWNTVSRGKTKDLLVSGGFDGFGEFIWKVHRTSAEGTERGRVIRDLLPYAVVIAGMQLLPFSTSGVGASASQKDGSPVKVVGSVANPAGEVIETLNLAKLEALQKGDINGEATPFLLGSPELFNFGTSVVGLEWGVSFPGTDGDSSTEDGDPDLTIFGDGFLVEQDGKGFGTYPVSTCLTVTETGGVFSANTCSDVRVELEAVEFVVESVQSLYWTSESCEASKHAVFNQEVTYRLRTLTLVDDDSEFTDVAMVEGTEVEALCGEIFESAIEACIFEVGDHFYVGDWNIGQFADGSCEPDDGTNEAYIPVKHKMAVLEIDASRGVFPSREEYEVSVAMLAEIVAGSGTIFSRQQLALVLGAFSRLSGMKLGIGIAHHPETVVVVTVSRVVLILWALLLAAGCVIHIRERRQDCKIFIPSTAWDWYAVGARESLGDGDASGSTPPSDHHYLAKYGCEKSFVEESDGIVQRLSWISPERPEAEVMGAGGALPIPPTSRRPDLSAIGEAVEASTHVPRSINVPLRRSVYS